MEFGERQRHVHAVLPSLIHADYSSQHTSRFTDLARFIMATLSSYVWVVHIFGKKRREVSRLQWILVTPALRSRRGRLFVRKPTEVQSPMLSSERILAYADTSRSNSPPEGLLPLLTMEKRSAPSASFDRAASASRSSSSSPWTAHPVSWC